MDDDERTAPHDPDDDQGQRPAPAAEDGTDPPFHYNAGRLVPIYSAGGRLKGFHNPSGGR